MNRNRLAENRADVLGRIEEAEKRSGRPAGSVRLVAVTKRCPTEWVESLVALGTYDLGENYPQELWSKVDAFTDPSSRWHLIGHLQGNKAKKTLPLVCLVHGVDSLKLLRTIDELGATSGLRSQVCLQVNTSSEESKHGWSPESLLADSSAIAGLKNVDVRGLMTIAGYGTTEESARASFRTLRDLRDRLRSETGLALPDLSMGMSNDFSSAIEEGATLVRVGSALFEGVDS